ncbi:sulfotransferase family protein [Rhodanobacter sp. C03]|uniref:sulfotransferase-like domain-containing protein n=1 Tax=Rhodanobacter sp. C03 TaxID=1945858 RepID=UPI00098684E9|nr:sulfotransferase family protein [Rhodanobacter sp. C03]OOG56217.1 sulfotransferase family protein [Rhodanobacter sp. C03]
MNAPRDGRRIAMWSGPRNISTAMMRAWENRTDTVVIDEPFYAHYLVQTGVQHPGRDEVIAAQNTDAAAVAAMLTGPIPDGRPLWYQKHMTQHMLPDMPLDWLDDVCNCFLIREPEAVVASFTIQRPDAAAWELGFEQQVRLFDHVCDRLGTTPPVIDATDVLKNPLGILNALCTRLRIPFSARMLQWPRGPRASDGVWAPHWYAEVERSTGFAPWREHEVKLTAFQRGLAEQCQPHYDRLSAFRLAAVRTPALR